MEKNGNPVIIPEINLFPSHIIQDKHLTKDDFLILYPPLSIVATICQEVNEKNIISLEELHEIGFLDKSNKYGYQVNKNYYRIYISKDRFDKMEIYSPFQYKEYSHELTNKFKLFHEYFNDQLNKYSYIELIQEAYKKQFSYFSFIKDDLFPYIDNSIDTEITPENFEEFTLSSFNEYSSCINSIKNSQFENFPSKKPNKWRVYNRINKIKIKKSLFKYGFGSDILSYNDLRKEILNSNISLEFNEKQYYKISYYETLYRIHNKTSKTLPWNEYRNNLINNIEIPLTRQTICFIANYDFNIQNVIEKTNIELCNDIISLL
jgi:hypothetical protein